MDQQGEFPPAYKLIERNEFLYRKHKKQKEEDIAICECQYDAGNPESACGDRCLNVLTSTECTPGYCPSGSHCKNQRFQTCQYAKSRLFKTEGRGWGLLADENIKAGQFVIEYCGEVISWKEAKQRSQAYESAGLKDAYIIYLNAYESIDATHKGSLARFINHSCQPNCETRKWNVLGEVRVGIFAKQEIPAGTELAYDYNFEWYGGAKVRCLCGAACCSGFLGAKSRGFQEATYLWEDNDDRFSVENVPLYDSEDDEPTSKSLKAIVPYKENEDFLGNADGFGSVVLSESIPMVVEPLNFVPMEVNGVKYETTEDECLYAENAQENFARKSAMISRIRSNSACRNYHIDSNSLSKTSSRYPGGKAKFGVRKQVNVKLICERLAVAEAREEIIAYEESKKQAAAQLDSLYDEIRPAIEEHERDNQDSVSTSVAEKWIEASCCKLKADFDFYSSIIKNIATVPRVSNDASPQRIRSVQHKVLQLFIFSRIASIFSLGSLFPILWPRTRLSSSFGRGRRASFVAMAVPTAYQGNTSAAVPEWLNKGDNAWQMVSATLVGLQSVPGLVILYGSIVKKKWAVNSAFMALYAFAAVWICWVTWAYNMSFGDKLVPFWGKAKPAFGQRFLIKRAALPATTHLYHNGTVETDMSTPYLPMASVVYFQCSFAAITVVLLAGSLLGRMNIKAWMAFVPLWLTFSYTVGAFSLWGGGFLFQWGVIDYSGGYVIHLSSGIAGLTAAYWVGPRTASDRERFPPNNVLLVLAGAGLLWMGWAGFNGGAPYAANIDASMAVLNTHVCAATSLLMWTTLDVVFFKKPSVIGAVQGMMTGLVCITPGAGLVQGWAAMVMGILSGSIPWFTMMVVHRRWSFLQNIDDTLGVFHTHAVAGFLGGAATGLFAEPVLCALFLPVTHSRGGVYGGVGGVQLLKQVVGAGFVVAWNAVVTTAICAAIRFVVPLRMSEDQLKIGDDEVHGEEAYALWGDGEALELTRHGPPNSQLESQRPHVPTGVTQNV
ncbi:unnamed protein product [Musa hybrid cultivar]